MKIINFCFTHGLGLFDSPLQIISLYILTQGIICLRGGDLSWDSWISNPDRGFFFSKKAIVLLIFLCSLFEDVEVALALISV